ncbi:MAG: hypothetical protein R3F30_02045 [Planctomycetota bacterium]
MRTPRPSRRRATTLAPARTRTEQPRGRGPRRPRRGAGRHNAGAGSVLALALLACCAAPLEDGFQARLDEGRLTAAETYHQSLLTQLGDAWNDRDLDRMEQLLAQPRAGAAPEQEWRYQRFDALWREESVRQRGWARLGFRLLAAEGADADDERDFTMSERRRVALVIDPIEGHEAVLQAVGPDGVHSRVFLDAIVEDLLADGSRLTRKVPDTIPIREDLVLTHAAPFVVDLPPLFEPSPEVYVRSIRIEGRILAAGFRWDGDALGVGQLLLDPLEYHRFPKGFKVIRAQPLKTLANALLAPDRYAGHVLVACWFLVRDGSDEDRERAVDHLCAALPTAPLEAEPTLLWALNRLVTKGGPLARDRDGWLGWAQSHGRGERRLPKPEAGGGDAEDGAGDGGRKDG